MTGDWKTDVSYGGTTAVCGKRLCKNPAVKVGPASSAHRVVTCAEHEDELAKIVLMMKENPNPTMPPTETVTWRRDDRPDIVGMTTG